MEQIGKQKQEFEKYMQHVNDEKKKDEIKVNKFKERKKQKVK